MARSYEELQIARETLENAYREALDKTRWTQEHGAEVRALREEAELLLKQEKGLLTKDTHTYYEKKEELTLLKEQKELAQLDDLLTEL
jgi:hypothetical protein